MLGLCALGYLLVWLAAVLGMLGLSEWAGQYYSSGVDMAGISHYQRVDGDLWRGSAPSAEGYRELAERGVTTVVDLRAEDLSAKERALPERAGLTVVRMPIRDGQTPTDQQVDRFVRTVRNADGDVFVHCGAGVGRTGSMSAAYLVRTGETSSLQAAVRTLAVGPPSIEQVYYVLTSGSGSGSGSGDGDGDQPPTVVKALSRVLDAPRRIAASL